MKVGRAGSSRRRARRVSSGRERAAVWQAQRLAVCTKGAGGSSTAARPARPPLLALPSGASPCTISPASPPPPPAPGKRPSPPKGARPLRLPPRQPRPSGPCPRRRRQTSPSPESPPPAPRCPPPRSTSPSRPCRASSACLSLSASTTRRRTCCRMSHAWWTSLVRASGTSRRGASRSSPPVRPGGRAGEGHLRGLVSVAGRGLDPAAPPRPASPLPTAPPRPAPPRPAPPRPAPPRPALPRPALPRPGPQSSGTSTRRLTPQCRCGRGQAGAAGEGGRRADAPRTSRRSAAAGSERRARRGLGQP
jgi:translation initiation factor IF-2